MQLIKMSSNWSRVGPKYNAPGIFISEGTQTNRHKEK